MLKIKDFRSSEISDGLCRELWSLRLENIRLRPDIDPEVDFKMFQNYFADASTRVTTFWDSSGRLQGFYGRNLKKVKVQGKPYLRVFLEYGFMNSQYRGRLEFILSLVLTGIGVLAKNIRLPKIAVGVAYPASYISCKLSYPNIMTLNSSELEEDQEEILKAFLHEYFEEGFIPTQNLVKMRTLPIDSSRTSKNPKVQQALAEYEAINNKWRDGYAMPILFEVSVKSFGWVLKRFLKSTLKKHSV